MLVSTRGRYGLRSMVDMAMNADKGPLPLRVIAERQGISESYLEQVFAHLRKAGLVTAVRGSYGGYLLSRPPKEITVGEILSALEGPMAPVNCIEDLKKGVVRCDRMEACITYPFWKKLDEKISAILNSTTLQDLVDWPPDDR